MSVRSSSVPRPRTGSRRLARAILGTLAPLAAAGVSSPGHAGGGGLGQVYDLRVITLTDDAAPGLFAGNFVDLATPAINASGQISFFGQTDGAVVGSGLWSTRFDDPAQLQLIAGEDLFPPGTPGGVRFAPVDFSYVRPAITDSGAMSFWSKLSGYSGGLREGIFRFDGTQLEPVALPDQTVPGVAGATFTSIANLEAVSGGGLVTFRAFMEGPGITEANDDALFVEWIGGLQMIVREGGAAPGLPGRTWAPLPQFATPQIAGNGRLTFRTMLGGGAAGAQALWSGFPGLLEPLVITGDILPNGRPFRWISGLIGFTSNDAGTVAARLIHGPAQDTSAGIFRFDDGVASAVADLGAAGPLGTYAEFEDSMQLSEDGTIHFIARFDGPGPDSDSALLRRRLGQPAEVLIREGDQAFGVGSGIVYDDMMDGFTWIATDGPGRAYVRATLRGPGINGDNDTGVWMIDEDGTVHLVLRGQQSVTVAPFDTRWVSRVTFRGGYGDQSGVRGGVNDRGDVALHVNFTDGSEAIIHAYLPPFCPADRNSDGFITFDDLLIVLADFENTGPVGTGGDADWDGDTDFDDLLLILSAFGSACSPV